MVPQEETLGCQKAEIKKRSNLHIRETNDPVAKWFKMSLHVYLEGLRVSSTMTKKQGWKCLVSESWPACKAFGNETVQISIALHFLEIFQKAQRDLTHPERATGLTRGS